MAQKTASPRQVVFLVYPGFTLLDLIASQSTLNGLTMDRRYRMVVVGEQAGQMVSDTPLSIMVQATFEQAAHPFALFVMGGGPATLQAMVDPALLAYVRSATETAAVVGAVGSGPLLLAKAGLLQNRQATIHWAYRTFLEQLGARYVPQPWVEDGKFITTGSVGGMDMALHLLAKLRDKGTARLNQLLAEYDPQPPFGGMDWSQVPQATPLSTRTAQPDLRDTAVPAHVN